MVQSRHMSYRRSHGMQGGDSDPMNFGTNDDSPESRGKTSDKQQEVLSFTNQLSSRTVYLYWLYQLLCIFGKDVQLPGWDLHSVVSAKFLGNDSPAPERMQVMNRFFELLRTCSRSPDFDLIRLKACG